MPFVVHQAQVGHHRPVPVRPPRFPQAHAYTKSRDHATRRATRHKSCDYTISPITDHSKPLTRQNVLAKPRICLRTAEIRQDSGRWSCRIAFNEFTRQQCRRRPTHRRPARRGNRPGHCPRNPPRRPRPAATGPSDPRSTSPGHPNQVHHPRHPDRRVQHHHARAVRVHTGYARAKHEAHIFIRQVLTGSGGIDPRDGFLTMRLDPLPTRRATTAIAKLCEPPTATHIRYPETNLTLRYEIKPGPEPAEIKAPCPEP